MKNIKKGEELSYDYGFGFDQDFKKYPCKCGSNKCFFLSLFSISRNSVKVGGFFL